jgi:hypothetical protein
LHGKLKNKKIFLSYKMEQEEYRVYYFGVCQKCGKHKTGYGDLNKYSLLDYPKFINYGYVINNCVEKFLLYPYYHHPTCCEMKMEFKSGVITKKFNPYRELFNIEDADGKANPKRVKLWHQYKEFSKENKCQSCGVLLKQDLSLDEEFAPIICEKCQKLKTSRKCKTEGCKNDPGLDPYKYPMVNDKCKECLKEEK